MRTVEQLRNDFAIYIQEIERCERAKCYWALLHVLLALPDVCASLEEDPNPGSPKRRIGDRYVDWCDAYLPTGSTVSASDRYQMRNALLHDGSTTAKNLKATHRTSYDHFSYVDPDMFDVTVHYTTDPSRAVLNVHVLAMARETKQALDSWFRALQYDPVKMSHVEQNIPQLARRQPKSIRLIGMDGSVVEEMGLTQSST